MSDLSPAQRALAAAIDDDHATLERVLKSMSLPHLQTLRAASHILYEETLIAHRKEVERVRRKRARDRKRAARGAE